jgi:hypothetical protein
MLFCSKTDNDLINISRHYMHVIDQNTDLALYKNQISSEYWLYPHQINQTTITPLQNKIA